MRFIIGLFKFIFQSIISSIRVILIGFGIGILLVFKINEFTNPEYGTNNIVLIVSVFTFFPLFVALFIEFLLSGIRKEKRKKKAIRAELENKEKAEVE